jgi:hypothetical protein
LASALAIVLLGTTAPRLAAQSDDFNDGNDTGWTRYSLPNIPANYPPYNLPSNYYAGATYSFPADDSGGKAYRISAPGITYDPLGLKNARAGSYWPNQYTNRFSAGVDLLAWNATWRQEAGLFFFLRDIGYGTSDGYTATYSSAYRQSYISAILNEVPTTVAELGTGAVTLDPTHRYRLVASSDNGYYFVLQLFDKADPNSPWMSAIADDFTWYNSGGSCGLFIFEQDPPPSASGADATFDNYAAVTPATGAMPAMVTDVSPPPAGKVAAMYPTVTVGILNRDTAVDTTSIVLCIDDVWIPHASLTVDTQVHKPNNPSGYTKDFAGATVTYAIPTLFPWGSKHTNRVAFLDSASAWQTNTWTWTTAYAYLFASNSLPVGSLSVRGFDTRMAQSTNGGVNLDNSLARALQQLAIPPQIPIDQTATSIVQVLDWNKASAPPANVPGLCPGGAINIAVESLAYLELTAGVHRFHINTDDGAGLYSGVNLTDGNGQLLWEKSSGTADTAFDFVVEAAGLYPVRCLWQETGGGAVLHLWSTNFVTGGPEVLINDSSDPAGVVKAWYPIACKSSSSVAGPYSVDSTAVNALNPTTPIVGSSCSPTVVGQMVTGGTFTVPVIPGATRFYRLDGPRATRITNISNGVSSIAITYQVE